LDGNEKTLLKLAQFFKNVLDNLFEFPDGNLVVHYVIVHVIIHFYIILINLPGVFFFITDNYNWKTIFALVFV